jgi:hypothetical protein
LEEEKNDLGKNSIFLRGRAIRNFKILIWGQVILLFAFTVILFFNHNLAFGTKKGVVKGIMVVEDSPPKETSAIINSQIVYEGDIIEGVEIVKIDYDKVTFEKNGKKWTQRVGGWPSNAWKEK